MFIRRSIFATVMVVALCSALLCACGTAKSQATARPEASALPPTCVAGVNLSTLAQFERLVGFGVDCIDAYDDAAPTWAAWDTPYFIGNHISADNFAPFVRKPHHELMITLSLIPDSVLDTDWRAAGAAGAYNRYAKILAHHLVEAHMGSAEIRLATEANGTWEKDSIGNTPQQWKQWVEFWRQTAIAMRSTAGAHFSFDWGIANGYRPIPFADYYPGNDVVSSVGVDVYDNAPSGTDHRFAYVDQEPGGLEAIAAFAKRERKPLIIPEWGIQSPADQGGGDDPNFVSGLARFITSNPVASEAYFFGDDNSVTLEQAPQSLALYRRDFRPGSKIVAAQ